MANKSAAKFKVAEKKAELTEEQKRKVLDHEIDSFKKIAMVNKVVKPRLGRDGTLIMGLFDFLLDQSG